jgi:hypothetical protein
MKQYTWVILLTIILLPACGRDTAPVLAPSFPPQEISADSILVAQCGLLEQAVEVFAAVGDGEYPENIDIDTLDTGESVLDLMPDGGVYVNPYTDKETVPVNGQATGPGAIAYAPIVVEETIYGYMITGFGEESIEVQLSNLASPEEALVLANCRTAVEMLREQLEEILANPYSGDYSNLYPLDEKSWDRMTILSSWTKYYGNTSDNPFTGDEELILRTADSPGETGYVCIMSEGRIYGYVVTGHGKDSVIFAESSFDCTIEEAVVISNCRTLEKALERFAWRNAGLYPSDIYNDRNADGKRVFDYLHASADLLNPYTGLRTEPSANTSGMPGQVSYEAMEYFGLRMGYRIRGFGEESQVLELTNIGTVEEATIRYNCYTLMEAVEEFAADNGGVYPEDLFADEDMSGETVEDLLPRGRAPLNPYTGGDDGLVNHTAVRPGQTGYARMTGRYSSWNSASGTETDNYDPVYVISGFSTHGHEFIISSGRTTPVEAIVISHCRTVQLAVEEFASRNGGIYPGNTGCDSSWYGDTVIDFLPGRALLENPTTGAATEPVDGAAATSGQVGFIPVCLNGMNVGYVITGTAEVCGLTTCTIFSAPDSDPYKVR